MDILKKLAGVLRGGKPASKTPNAPAAPAQTLSNKLMKAITPEAKPYRIMVRGADGELISTPATREEMLAYCNRDSTWRRIA